MRFRDRLALAVPPTLLRLLLAVVFIWAGLGKIVAEETVGPEQAAVLANMGAIPAPRPSLPPPPAPPQPNPDLPSPPDSSPPADPGSLGSLNLHSSGAQFLRVQSTPRTVSPADFPAPVTVQRVYALAAALYQAAQPQPDHAGNPGRPLMPQRFGRGNWPIILAWTVALSEMIVGLMLLVGLLTRLAALAVAFIMLSAMWLTQIGPAVRSGQTFLGFLPSYPPFGSEWTTFLIQLAMLIPALCLVCSGAGPLSLDRAIFARPPADEDDEDNEHQQEQES